MRSLLLLLVVAGCAPNPVRGTVTTMPATCAGDHLAPAQPAPLPGAEVVLGCPGRAEPLASTRADERGEFRFDLDDVTATCWVEVRAAGYWSRRYQLADLCWGEGDEDCHGGSVTARLLRRGGPR